MNPGIYGMGSGNAGNEHPPIGTILWHALSMPMRGTFSISVTNDNTNAMFGYVALQSSAAVNDAWENHFYVHPGKYVLRCVGRSQSSAGITHFELNGRWIGLADSYAASNAINGFPFDVEIPTKGKNVLRGYVPAKNASSSGFQMPWTVFFLLPAALRG